MARRNGSDWERDDPSDDDLARFEDVSIRCRACGTMAYDDAELCPKCLSPLHGHAKGTPKWLVVVGILLVLAMLIPFVLPVLAGLF